MLFVALLQTGARAFDLRSPADLASFSSDPVYSIMQDNRGAMWFNTESGAYRFNGHTLSLRSQSNIYLSRFSSFDGQSIYLNSPGSVLRFSSDLDNIAPELVLPSLPENSPLLAEGDSLLFAVANKISSYRDGVVSEVALLDEGVHIRSLERLDSGELLVATYESGIGVLRDGVYVTCLSIDAQILRTRLMPDGSLWVGTSSDGLFKVNTHDFSVLSQYREVDGQTMIDVRSFATTRDGTLFFGAASGLYSLGLDGTLSRIPIEGILTNAVCDVFVDRDGDLWVSTYDNGVFYANMTSSPFRNLTEGLTMGTPRGFAISDDGTLWAATDPDGLLAYVGGKWTDIPSLREYKFQSAYFDPVTKDLFLGNWDGLVRYNPRTGAHRLVSFSNDISVGARIPVFTIMRGGGELYLGTPLGAFAFKPVEETVISRRVDGIDSRMTSSAITSSGDVILGGEGLFRISDGVGEMIYSPETGYYNNICFDSEGNLWAAMSTSVACFESSGGVTRFDRTSCGLPERSILFAVPLPDGKIVVGTTSGITVMDTRKRACLNYDITNGVHFKSTSQRGFHFMPDGTLILGGNGAIEALAPSGFTRYTDRMALAFDAITVNDTPCENFPAPGQTLLLDHKSTNITFDVASFDYTGIGKHIYSYKLDGLDSEWREFDLSEPIKCMNLSPGQYRIRVRESDNLESVRAEISMPIRIMPVWYLSLPFILLWIMIMAAVALFILYNLYARAMLRRRLIMEEEQNARQANFFLNLSLKMRTPLNLMIGQIERYFKEYGSRARGVEDIQDVYGQATEIRGMISEFVDESNEHLERRSKYSKLLNAATGVVERNLFTGKLDVPLLCKELNMGKTKLTETLKEASGMTPREFIEDIRLKYAAQMILEGNHTVTEVSDSLGFSTPKYFAVRFKQKFGCPPSAYRR